MKRKILIIIFLILVLVIFIGFKVTKNQVNQKMIDKEKIIAEALKLYNKKKAEGMVFNSQCLGTIEVDNEKYVVDIVHVPRTEEDNLPENQCEDFRTGKVKHFIELDKNGKVVRIV